MVNGIRRDTVAKFWAPRGLVGLASVLAFLLSLLPIDALAREQRHARRRAQGPSSAPPAAVSRSQGGGSLAAAAPLKAKEVPFADVKFIIEHNATAADTGFQVFLDGDPWNRLTIDGPDHKRLLEIKGRGELRKLGLTELFFETNEPENAEVPIEELLALFPEGEYDFGGRSVEGLKLTGTATLTHAIPAGPVILSPTEGAVVDPTDTVIRWELVTETITGAPVEIVGYEVIVTKLVDVNPPGFSKPVMSVHVSTSTASLTVPKEFLEPGTEYEFEVLALEAGGNQTISSSTFVTE